MLESQLGLPIELQIEFLSFLTVKEIASGVSLANKHFHVLIFSNYFLDNPNSSLKTIGGCDELSRMFWHKICESQSVVFSIRSHGFKKALDFIEKFQIENIYYDYPDSECDKISSSFCSKISPFVRELEISKLPQTPQHFEKLEELNVKSILFNGISNKTPHNLGTKIKALHGRSLCYYIDYGDCKFEQITIPQFCNHDHVSNAIQNSKKTLKSLRIEGPKHVCNFQPILDSLTNLTSLTINVPQEFDMVINLPNLKTLIMTASASTIWKTLSVPRKQLTFVALYCLGDDGEIVANFEQQLELSTAKTLFLRDSKTLLFPLMNVLGAEKTKNNIQELQILPSRYDTVSRDNETVNRIKKCPLTNFKYLKRLECNFLFGVNDQLPPTLKYLDYTITTANMSDLFSQFKNSKFLNTSLVIISTDVTMFFANFENFNRCEQFPNLQLFPEGIIDLRISSIELNVGIWLTLLFAAFNVSNVPILCLDICGFIGFISLKHFSYNEAKQRFFDLAKYRFENLFREMIDREQFEIEKVKEWQSEYDQLFSETNIEKFYLNIWHKRCFRPLRILFKAFMNEYDFRTGNTILETETDAGTQMRIDVN